MEGGPVRGCGRAWGGSGLELGVGPGFGGGPEASCQLEGLFSGVCQTPTPMKRSAPTGWAGASTLAEHALQSAGHGAGCRRGDCGVDSRAASGSRMVDRVHWPDDSRQRIPLGEATARVVAPSTCEVLGTLELVAG
ncbi:hypothetical protein FQR65_LT20654 [Abscondita terminalis]|nr:hypothetical protein FQR65_LT20654 [Abscondita terminalis]